MARGRAQCGGSEGLREGHGRMEAQGRWAGERETRRSCGGGSNYVANHVGIQNQVQYLLSHALLLRFLPPTAEADPCAHSLESAAKPSITAETAEILFRLECCGSNPTPEPRCAFVRLQVTCSVLFSSHTAGLEVAAAFL